MALPAVPGDVIFLDNRILHASLPNRSANDIRWHRRKDQSGGLLVHKATHHFDLVNWWIASRPETVTALGARRFYVESTAESLGLGGHGERCHGCPMSGIS